jgi:hypothetical protein
MPIPCSLLPPTTERLKANRRIAEIHNWTLETGDGAMQAQCDTRVKKRVSCTLNLESRHHRGMILNLSQRGLFVQTTLPAEPGTLVDIDLDDPRRGESIAVQAAVVWRRRVSPRMTGINQSGMGMRILMNSPQYENLLAGMLGESTERTESTHSNKPAATSGAAPGPDLERYVVRLAQDGGPRSRRAVVQCESERSARAKALEQVGDGWTIIEVVRR